MRAVNAFVRASQPAFVVRDSAAAVVDRATLARFVDRPRTRRVTGERSRRRLCDCRHVVGHQPLILLVVSLQRATLVAVDGELDLRDTPVVISTVERVVAEGAPAVIIDLAGAKLLDPSAVTALLDETLARSAVALLVACPDSAIRRLLGASRLGSRLTVFASLEAAAHSLVGDGPRSGRAGRRRDHKR